MIELLKKLFNADCNISFHKDNHNFIIIKIEKRSDYKYIEKSFSDYDDLVINGEHVIDVMIRKLNNE